MIEPIAGLARRPRPRPRSIRGRLSRDPAGRAQVAHHAHAGSRWHVVLAVNARGTAPTRTLRGAPLAAGTQRCLFAVAYAIDHLGDIHLGGSRCSGQRRPARFPCSERCCRKPTVRSTPSRNRSSIEREWRWRLSRGESTANLRPLSTCVPATEVRRGCGAAAQARICRTDHRRTGCGCRARVHRRPSPPSRNPGCRPALKSSQPTHPRQRCRYRWPHEHPDTAAPWRAEWNALNLFTGWVDVDLTEKGRGRGRARWLAAGGLQGAPNVVLHTSGCAGRFARPTSPSTCATGTGFRSVGHGGSTRGTTERCRQEQEADAGRVRRAAKAVAPLLRHATAGDRPGR